MAKMHKLKINGGIVIVDAHDADWLQNHKWHVAKNGYANTAIYINAKRIGLFGMHRLIMNTPKGQIIDHINGDKLDNRRQNLRICSRAQNNMNRTRQRTNKTKYKGICWRERAQKWQAQISLGNRAIYLGHHNTAKAAAAAYNAAAIRLYGVFAKLNKL